MKCSIDKELPFEIKTYEDARRLLLFLESVFHLFPEIDKSSLRYEFMFKNGKIICNTDNRQEFLNEIFGVTDFRLKRMDLTFSDRDTSLYISLTYFCGFAIYSSDKGLLAKFSDAYDNEVARLKDDNKQAVVVIEKHEHNTTNIDQSGQININGDVTSSSIATSGFGATTNQSVEKQKSISFWKPILQSLIANWIWWVLGVFGAAIVSITAYFVKFKQGQ